MHIRFGYWPTAALAVCLWAAEAALSAESATRIDDSPPPMPAVLPATRVSEFAPPLLTPIVAPVTSTPIVTGPTPTVTVSAPATRPAGPSQQLSPIVVTSNLDTARDQIAPSLGAVTYTIGQEQIDSIPQGENAPFQQVLLQNARGRRRLIRAGARSRRAREHHVSRQRRDPAGAVEWIRAGVGHIFDRFDDANRRDVAGAIRISHGGDHRRDHQDRTEPRFQRAVRLRWIVRHVSAVV